MRLLTIPISHYCEKARWALERAGIAYREERHVQGLHQLYARRAGGGDTVPVLVGPEEVLGDSDQILEWVDERTPPEHRLYPAEPRARAEVQRLCRRLDSELGPRARRLMYVHMLAERDLMLRFNNAGVPRWEDRMIRIGWPLVWPYARRRLSIEPGVDAEDEVAVWRELDFVAGLMADGRPHLAGERFGAADLTFASLAAAVLVPPIYGTPLPQPELLPARTAALVERARAHPAGRYAMGVIESRRRAVVPRPDATG